LHLLVNHTPHATHIPSSDCSLHHQPPDLASSSTGNSFANERIFATFFCKEFFILFWGLQYWSINTKKDDFFFTKSGESACSHLPDAEKKCGDKTACLKYFKFV
jgi:hypothetical protein